MDEKKVIKRLVKIQQKRLKHKETLAERCEIKDSEVHKPKPPKKSLTEEEIAERIKKWRETPDQTCVACGICSPKDEDKGD